MGAAASVCRRGDASSLLAGALMYQSEGQQREADIHFLDAIKMSGAKGEFDKMDAIIERAPQFKVRLD